MYSLIVSWERVGKNKSKHSILWILAFMDFPLVMLHSLWLKTLCNEVHSCIYRKGLGQQGLLDPGPVNTRFLCKALVPATPLGCLLNLHCSSLPEAVPASWWPKQAQITHCSTKPQTGETSWLLLLLCSSPTLAEGRKWKGGRGKKPHGACTTLCDGLLFFYWWGNEGKTPETAF